MSNRATDGLPRISKRARLLYVIGASVLLALILGGRALSMYVDWLWFSEVDAQSVFATVLLTRAALFVVVGAVVGAAVGASLVIAFRRRPLSVSLARHPDALTGARTVVLARARMFGVGIPVLVGLIAGATAQADWRVVQLFFHGGDFGRTDPEFGLDAGFYVFRLPFYGWVLGWLLAVLILAFLAGAMTHYLFGGIRLAQKGGQISAPARVQLGVTAGIFVLLMAVEYFLDRYDLLFSDRSELFTGATYTDLAAVLPAKLILAIIAVFCAVAFFVGAFLRRVQLPAIALVLLIVSGVVLGAVWPAILEQVSVKPNAIEKEADPIRRNISATKYAFDLDDVRFTDYDSRSSASEAAVRDARGTIANIRLLDPAVLEPTFTQRVGRQNIYGFPEELDVDRYTLGDRTQDYIVAAKEINTEGLAENQRSWINRHLVYTHGNGFVAAPANKINRAVSGTAGGSDAGYPVAGTSDTSNPTGSGIRVDEPRIYYGELTTDYAIVRGADSPGEFDTPTERDYRYGGEGGVPIDGWFHRAVFFAWTGHREVLFSDAVGDGSRILYNRDPADRVQKKAPWLTVDGDPYPAVIDGRIKWIVDAYTTTDSFPYAQQVQLGDEPASYLRNSVKATVDAYDGTVTLYSVEDAEPVLAAWRSVFPGLVKPSSAISDELRAHFRYPEDVFRVQRELLTKYHVGSPQEFYSTNTFWSVPADPTQRENEADQSPYYVLAQLTGDERSTFQLTSPLTPLRRQYLAAWMSASSDPASYGQIRVLRLPTDDPANQTDGPVQVQNRFQSDPRVAQERTLFNNPDIQVIWGNQLTLPVAGGFLYVEPVYIQQTSENSYPQLARVLVQFGGRVGFAATLPDSLEQVLGEQAAELATPPEAEAGEPPAEEDEPPPVDAALSPQAAEAARQMQQAWARYQQAQAAGDYAAQGEALQELDAAAKRYAEATNPEGR